MTNEEREQAIKEFEEYLSKLKELLKGFEKFKKSRYDICTNQAPLDVIMMNTRLGISCNRLRKTIGEL